MEGAETGDGTDVAGTDTTDGGDGTDVAGEEEKEEDTLLKIEEIMEEAVC